MKTEIRGAFGTKEQTTKQTDNEPTKRGAGLIPLGALTAVTARAGIARFWNLWTIQMRHRLGFNAD